MPQRLLEARAFAVLVDADELIARPALAALFASRFGPDGSITTVEGNSSNAVTRRHHGPGGDGAVGYVRLG